MARIQLMINQSYMKLALFILKHSNSIAVIMMLIAVFVCFSTNTWLYLICLVAPSVYLGILTSQYITIEDEVEADCDIQQGCYIATFNSRLSILSNITIAFFGIAFSILTAYYLINTPSDVDNAKYFDISNGGFIVGWFKLMFIYIISDKIHSLQYLLSILLRYSQTIKYLNINLPKDKTTRFPLIYIDERQLSIDRYSVAISGKLANIYFEPPISINDNSKIEYTFVEEDENHVIQRKTDFDIYNQPNCFFRCHVVLRNTELNKKDDSHENSIKTR